MKTTLILACLLIYSSLFSQTPSPVTAVFTHFVNATTGTQYTGGVATGTSTASGVSGTYTYDFGTKTQTTNNTEILDSFTVNSTTNYHFVATTPTIAFRRVNNTSVTGLRKSLWAEENASVQTATIMASTPPYADSLEELFSGQIFNMGMDNNFQNATTTNNNNIERVDVIFPGGITATTSLTQLGFVVFDRGASGGHDPFVIAAISSLDGSGNPSGYFTSVSATAAEYGNVASTSIPYNIFRRNPTDADLLVQTTGSTQQRDGVFFSFTTLNVPTTSTKVYGYSIFSTDDVTTTSAEMVAYTAFPTTSDLSGGGIDQVAVTGLAVTKPIYVVLAEYLENFSASPVSGGVQLTWGLANTDNLMQVVLQRSGNGTDYSPLQNFSNPSAGQQTTLDAHPLAGVNYYRLELIDRQGREIAYSQVSAVTIGPNAAIDFNIYPNPVRTRQFNLTAQGLSDGETYGMRIVDMKGNFVLVQSLIGETSLNRSFTLPENTPAGIYMVRLTDKEGQPVLVRSLVVE
jgi:hypothetical protein